MNKLNTSWVSLKGFIHPVKLKDGGCSVSWINYDSASLHLSLAMHHFHHYSELGGDAVPQNISNFSFFRDEFTTIAANVALQPYSKKHTRKLADQRAIYSSGMSTDFVVKVKATITRPWSALPHHLLCVYVTQAETRLKGMRGEGGESWDFIAAVGVFKPQRGFFTALVTVYWFMTEHSVTHCSSPHTQIQHAKPSL